MATTGSDSPKVAVNKIDLKVLTNTAQSLVRIDSLSCETTVGEVKARVRDELNTSVPLDRMRLIYRGRILPNDLEPLQNIFGTEALRQSKEQSLHLVVPDLARAQHEHATTAGARAPATPTNPFRTASNVSTPDVTVQTNPFRAASQTPSRPGSIPHGQPSQFTPQGMAATLPPTGLPPDVDNMIRQQVEAAEQLALRTALANAQAHGQQPQAGQGAQGSGVSTPVSAQSTGSSMPADNNQPRWGQPNVFQQVIAQQQQQRAAATGQGQGQDRPTRSPPLPDARSQQPMQQLGMQNGGPPPGPPGVNVMHREVTGPNGARMTIRVEQSAVATRQQPGSMPFPNPGQMPGMMGMPPMPAFPPYMHPAQMARSQSPNSNAQLVAQTRSLIDRVNTDGQRVLDRMDELRAGQTVLPRETNEQLEQMRLELADIVDSVRDTEATFANLQAGPAPQTHPHPHPTSSARSSPAPFGPSQIAQQVFARPIPHTRAPPTVPHPPQGLPNRHVTSPEVYLLAGPQGPYGLVLSPQGTYRSSPILPLAQYTTASNRLTPQPQPQAQIQNARLPVPPNAPNDNGNVAAGPAHVRLAARIAAQNVAPGAAVAGEQARPGQPGAQANRNMPLAQGLWVAIRLFFFLYMFTNNSGWRRPIMIGAIALVVYIYHLGWFNTPIERVRRHIETLLPLPEEQQAQHGQQNQTQAEGGGHPTPQQTAQRLLQQRHDNNTTWIRNQIRAAERAVALFLASFVPGLGERMIATREERLRGQREEEEQRQRDREAQQTNEANAAAATGPTDVATSQTGAIRATAVEEATEHKAEASSAERKDKAVVEPDEEIIAHSAQSSGVSGGAENVPTERRTYEASE